MKMRQDLPIISSTQICSHGLRHAICGHATGFEQVLKTVQPRHICHNCCSNYSLDATASSTQCGGCCELYVTGMLCSLATSFSPGQ